MALFRERKSHILKKVNEQDYCFSFFGYLIAVHNFGELFEELFWIFLCVSEHFLYRCSLRCAVDNNKKNCETNKKVSHRRREKVQKMRNFFEFFFFVIHKYREQNEKISIKNESNKAHAWIANDFVTTRSAPPFILQYESQANKFYVNTCNF